MRETRTALPEVVRFKAPAGFMAASCFLVHAIAGHPVPPLQPGNSLWPSTYKDLRR